VLLNVPFWQRFVIQICLLGAPEDAFWFQRASIQSAPEKNGERGKLGQERLEVGWEVVMFLFNIVNLNV
jgi:hypothetical protein